MERYYFWRFEGEGSAAEGSVEEDNSVNVKASTLKDFLPPRPPPSKILTRGATLASAQTTSLLTGSRGDLKVL